MPPEVRRGFAAPGLIELGAWPLVRPWAFALRHLPGDSGDSEDYRRYALLLPRQLSPNFCRLLPCRFTPCASTINAATPANFETAKPM